jgi:hypothetical protein
MVLTVNQTLVYDLQKKVSIALFLGATALAGFLAPPATILEFMTDSPGYYAGYAEVTPKLRLVYALISLSLGMFAFAVVHLVTPVHLSKKWVIVRAAAICVVWLVLVGILLYLYHLMAPTLFYYLDRLL